MRTKTLAQPHKAAPSTPAQDKAPKAKPKTITVVKKPQSVPGRELTETQQTACDLAADLIINGGDEDDVHQLLWGILGHNFRRRFPGWPSDPAERDKKAEDHILALKGRWYAKLAKQWSEPIARRKRPIPNTVGEMARDNARRRLERVFYEDYVGGAPTEDVYLLQEILEDAYGSGKSLPDAFAYKIGADHTWVKVPDEHVKRVEQFIELVKGQADAA
ncbi:MAG: hypothetical protein ACR2NN_26045 [Bryobacteraceae bacterium]